MKKIVVVGSGPSGTHFALSVLRKGHEVVLLDVGKERPPIVNAAASVNQLKESLDDPVSYFLGQRYEAVLYPGSKGEYYGFPPNKHYVFNKPVDQGIETAGFSPLTSFAQGGLAEAWTGGVYSFNDEELADFPFSYKDIEPYYHEVASRIGISGAKDDLASHIPFPDHIMDPLELDPHSQDLLGKYERKKGHLNNKLDCYMGRSRLATLSREWDGRKSCSFCGRCLWGCPSGALYTPSVTLNQCKQYKNFTYVPNQYVTHFECNGNNRIAKVVAECSETKHSRSYEADSLVLAAGTLSSSQIFLESWRRHYGEIPTLTGLMDNPQVLIPFINLNMIGKGFKGDSYQYNQLAMGFKSEKPKEYKHALITTLKTGLVHPLIHKIPCNLQTGVFLFRQIHAALGLVNLNLHDTRRANNFITLKDRGPKTGHTLFMTYTPDRTLGGQLKGSIKRVKKALWELGCVVPPGMCHVRPMGASVHYAGTIPMSRERTSLTVSPLCRSHDFENLYVVDGATFPFLPAKNITFTLMANAVRVAEKAF